MYRSGQAYLELFCCPKSETLSTRLLRLCWWWLRRRGQGDLQVVRRLTTVSLSSSSSSQQDANFKFPFSFPEEKGTKALTAEADTHTHNTTHAKAAASEHGSGTNKPAEREKERNSLGWRPRKRPQQPRFFRLMVNFQSGKLRKLQIFFL